MAARIPQQYGQFTPQVMRRRRIVNVVMIGVFSVCAIIILIPLVHILIYSLIKGASSLNINFFTKPPSPPGQAGGGVATALAQMAFPTLRRDPIGVALTRAEAWSGGLLGELESYFGECGGFVVEASDGDALEAIASDVVDFVRIGETIASSEFALGEVRFDLRELFEIWRAPLAEVYP